MEISGADESFHEIDNEDEKAQVLCYICGKNFKTGSGLKRHVTQHNNTSKYKCSKCSQTFNNRGHYEGHVNTHDIKPFRCQKCNVRYAYRSALLRHTPSCGKSGNGHSKPVEFKCDICGSTFTRKDILRDHLAGKHESRLKYTCETCGVNFKWRSSLSRHRNTSKGHLKKGK